jgi:hypothetical protein
MTEARRRCVACRCRAHLVRACLRACVCARSTKCEHQRAGSRGRNRERHVNAVDARGTHAHFWHRQDAAPLLALGLADDWSQVRFAASVATRSFMAERIPPFPIPGLTPLTHAHAKQRDDLVARRDRFGLCACAHTPARACASLGARRRRPAARAATSSCCCRACA